MKRLRNLIASVLVVFILLTAVGCGNNSSSFNNNGGSHLGAGSLNEDSNTNTTGENTGVTLSDNLWDFTLQIDGVVYKLPMDISAFKNNGWAFPDYFDTSKQLTSDSYESTKLEKNGEKIDVELINKTGEAQKAGDCPVGRITYNFSGSLKINLAGNYDLNAATLDNLIAKFGAPTSNEIYGESTEVMYEKEGASSIYERYTFKFNTASGEIEEVNIVNFIATKTTMNSADAGNDNAKGYIEPTALGTDPATFNVSVLGELYTLPAPVSAFIENGWELQSSVSIGAGTYNDNVSLSKNGKTFVFGAFNFSDKQAEVKDCTIYKVTQDEYENVGLDLIVPGNIKIGSSATDAAEAFSGLDKSESATGITYLINSREHMFEVYVSKDTQKVISITVLNRVLNNN